MRNGRGLWYGAGPGRSCGGAGRWERRGGLGRGARCSGSVVPGEAVNAVCGRAGQPLGSRAAFPLFEGPQNRAL